MVIPLGRMPPPRMPPGGGGSWGAWNRAALLELVLDGLIEGVVVTDVDRRIRFANRMAAKLLGPVPPEGTLCTWLTAAGLEGLDGERPCAPEQLPLARALRGEEVAEQMWLLRAPGAREPRHLSLMAHPLPGLRGGIDGAIVVLRDVTARLLATEGLERLSRAIEQTADMVVITDRMGTIIYVNGAFTSMTGYAKAEALGLSPSILRSGMHPPSFFAALWATILGGDVFRGTIVNRRRDGTLYSAEQTITPMKDGSGRVTHFVSVSKDMTERNRLREREVEAQLAADVQRKLYPLSCPGAGDLDVAGAVFPAEATCGDYYDMVMRPDGWLLLAVGDVSGHGMGPALLMAETRAYLRSLAATPLAGDAILTQINTLLRQDLTDDQFVTLLLAEIEPSTGRIRYASAGHVPAFKLGADGTLPVRLEPDGAGPGGPRGADVSLPRGAGACPGRAAPARHGRRPGGPGTLGRAARRGRPPARGRARARPPVGARGPGAPRRDLAPLRRSVLARRRDVPRGPARGRRGARPGVAGAVIGAGSLLGPVEPHVEPVGDGHARRVAAVQEADRPPRAASGARAPSRAARGRRRPRARTSRIGRPSRGRSSRPSPTSRSTRRRARSTRTTA